MHVVSFSPFGYEGSLVKIEVDLRRGIPAVDMVGLADNAVKESRERMRAAIVNSGFEFPKERVLISLSPADVRKEGAGFDLAVALAVLNAQQNLDGCSDVIDEEVLVMGELELSGRIRPVRGIHAAVATAAEAGVKFCIVCEENSVEASGVKGVTVISCSDLREAFQKVSSPSNFFKHNFNISSLHKSQITEISFPPVEEGMDYETVLGLPFLVKGLQIAAAGGHNLIAFGPPGCGKTLALQRFPSLLPYLDTEEAQSVTRIHSLAGLIGPDQKLVEKKSFRMPHQSASLEGMIGGGPHCLPGEVSLAHNGVLFLDEASEFRTSVLQTLRVPLEQHSVTLSRAGRHTVFPSDFQLLVATNPCPCGNFGDESKICLCSARAVEQHWKKFSAPLLDRIDIRIPVFSKKGDEHVSSEELRVKIAVAIKNQKNRQGKLNARLTPEEVSYFCKLSDECKELLDKAADEFGFSSRAVNSCIKIARTIADMEDSYEIRISDLTEAISYRKSEGGLSICF